MYEMGEQLERVILAGVQTYESDDTVQSLYELRELAETAGAVTVGTIISTVVSSATAPRSSMPTAKPPFRRLP